MDLNPHLIRYLDSPFQQPRLWLSKLRLHFYIVFQHISVLEKIIQADDSWDKIAEFNEVSDDNIKLVTLRTTKSL